MLMISELRWWPFLYNVCSCTTLIQSVYSHYSNEEWYVSQRKGSSVCPRSPCSFQQPFFDTGAICMLIMRGGMVECISNIVCTLYVINLHVEIATRWSQDILQIETSRDRDFMSYKSVVYVCKYVTKDERYVIKIEKYVRKMRKKKLHWIPNICKAEMYFLF